MIFSLKLENDFSNIIIHKIFTDIIYNSFIYYNEYKLWKCISNDILPNFSKNEFLENYFQYLFHMKCIKESFTVEMFWLRILLRKGITEGFRNSEKKCFVNEFYYWNSLLWVLQ